MSPNSEASFDLRYHVETLMAIGLPILSFAKNIAFLNDITYLLRDNRNHFRDYHWEHEPVHVVEADPVPRSGSRTPSWHTDDDSVSVSSEDSTTQSHPYPTDFDSMTEESCKTIAITMKEGPEVDRMGDVKFEGHVARLSVGEFVLMKGRSTESAMAAMEDMFGKVHALAEQSRAKGGVTQETSG